MTAGCSDLPSLLTRYGFTELTPPSTLFAPGTLVWVWTGEGGQRGGAKGTSGVVCTAAASLGPAFRPLLSPSASRDVSRAASGALDVDVGRLRGVRNVTARLRDVSVLTVSDTDVWAGLRDRSPACSRAVAARLNAGYEVTMVAAALRADVDYTVTLEGEGSGASRGELFRALGVKGDAGDELTGRGLYWGIVDDAYLGALNGSSASPPAVMPGTRLLGPGSRVES